MSIDTYFCFCCLSTNDLSPIYNGTHEDYGNILLQLFNLNISYEDYEYDGQVCKDCGQRLKDAFQFKSQVFGILNILQSNGLIEISNADQKTTVRKITNGNLEVDEKYSKVKIEEIITFEPAPAETIQTAAIKKELTETIKLKTERDKTVNGSVEAGQTIAQYVVTADLKCEICAMEMPNAYVYHLHMNQHFPNHVCDTCGKGFLTEKRLKRHLPSHKKGPFQCQMCDSEFANYNTLNSHRQRKHSSIELYKCPHCPERFGTFTRRAVHLTAAHAQPPGKYQCGMCDKRFLISGSLSSHIRNTHQKVKRNWCPECRVGFNQKQELTAHMAIHTGVNLFQCLLCPKRYPRKKSLRVHMRTHADDRRFPCGHCGKRFLQKCTLLVHIKTHNRAEKTDK